MITFGKCQILSIYNHPVPPVTSQTSNYIEYNNRHNHPSHQNISISLKHLNRDCKAWGDVLTTRSFSIWWWSSTQAAVSVIGGYCMTCAVSPIPSSAIYAPLPYRRVGWVLINSRGKHWQPFASMWFHLSCEGVCPSSSLITSDMQNGHQSLNGQISLTSDGEKWCTIPHAIVPARISEKCYGDSLL